MIIGDTLAQVEQKPEDIQSREEARRRLAWPFSPECRGTTVAPGLYAGSLIIHEDIQHIDPDGLPARSGVAVSYSQKTFVYWADGLIRTSDAGCDWIVHDAKVGEDFRLSMAARGEHALFWKPGRKEIYRFNLASHELSMDSAPGTIDVLFQDQAGGLVGALNYEACTLHISDDDGATWRPRDLPLDDCQNADGAIRDEIVAIVRPDGILLVSENRGETWTRHAAPCRTSDCNVSVTIVEADLSYYLWILLGLRASLFDLGNERFAVSNARVSDCSASIPGLFPDNETPQVLVAAVVSVSGCGLNRGAKLKYMYFNRDSGEFFVGDLENMPIPPDAKVSDLLVNPGNSSAVWFALARRN